MYDICMKPITFNVSEPIYALFQAEAKKRDRTTSELIRDAMETYIEERIRTKPSLEDWKPLSLGKVKLDWAGSAIRTIRGEMLSGRYDK